MSQKASKGRFLKPENLQNHRNEGKGKRKKKDREGKEEKRKKAMVALLVFIKHVVTLDEKGPFGEIVNVFKILARYEFIFMVVFWRLSWPSSYTISKYIQIYVGCKVCLEGSFQRTWELVCPV